MSTERGETTTAVICLTTAYLRIIRIKMELMDGAPPGSIWACNSTSLMKQDVFTQWFEHIYAT